MKISRLARLIGMTPSSIRFYRDRGLLPAPTRASNGYRYYQECHVKRLRLIQRCRRLDMSLEGIRMLIEALEHPDRAHAQMMHEQIHCQVEQIEQRVAELLLLKKELMELLGKCSGMHDNGVCPMLTSLEQQEEREKRSQ